MSTFSSQRPDGSTPDVSTLGSTATSSSLLVLGQNAVEAAERGTVCPGDVPPASDPNLVQRARTARDRLGDDVFILGHHYQRDEVIEFADARGDSFKLAREAAENGSKHIIFCGVHFMAETADILTPEDATVILPDLAAGCSMADMAEVNQVETAWNDIVAARGGTGKTIPMTYMNSTAAIKSFTGQHDGVVCTSSNAERAMRWAFEQGDQILFLPDQHLGRNTAVLKLGLSLDECVVYNPAFPQGGLTSEQLATARVVLWKGHCSVHATFTPEHVDLARKQNPDVQIIVHPECRYDVVRQADVVGSTSQIIAAVEASTPGTAMAIATELNLVGRLASQYPDRDIMFLNDNVCFCATMQRIDLAHLVWSMEELLEGRVVNPIRVDDDTAKWAKIALERMLALPGI